MFNLEEILENYKIFEYNVIQENGEEISFIEIVFYLNERSLILFAFEPKYFPDEGKMVLASNYNVRINVGTAILNDLTVRRTYYNLNNAPSNKINKYKKLYTFQLKSKGMQKLSKKVYEIYLSYYKKENKNLPEYILAQRITGSQSSKSKIIAYNINDYIKKYKTKNNLDIKIEKRIKPKNYKEFIMKNDPCFYDVSHLEEAKLLEKEYINIKKEVENLPEEIYEHWHEAAITNNLWFMLPLKLFDIEHPAANNLLPKTMELLRSINPIQASISVLKPNAEIYPHTDVLDYNGKEDILISKDSYRMQLGLSIPEGDCQIGVKNPYEEDSEYEYRKWEESKITCINDSFLHQAHNKTDKNRVVLIVDIPKENVELREEQIQNLIEHFMKVMNR